MRNLKTLIPLLLFTLLMAAPRGHAEVASTNLKQLTGHSEAIAVARVHQVDTIGGVKVARATVLRSLIGMRANQRFAFIAQPTWACDSSTAVPGETVLLFLSKPAPYSHFVHENPQFQSARARQLQGIPLYGIAWSGFGRMPLQRLRGKDYLTARRAEDLRNRNQTALWVNGVQLPSGLPSFPHPGQSGARLRLVPLQSVAEWVMRAVKTKKRQIMAAQSTLP